MKARVQVIKNNKTTLDQTWLQRKPFSNRSVQGCMADKIRLDIELDSVADIVALIDWCNVAHLCFKK
jgi:hypothetical protein